jgi:C-terminal processing protease CtpA/Prc
VTLTPTPFPVDRSRGIAPDIEVAPPTSEDYAADRDPQLERAAQFLLTGN